MSGYTKVGGYGDWYATSTASFSGGAGIAGGFWQFMFYNKAAQYGATYLYFGAGLGGGIKGGAGGTSLPFQKLKWTQLSVSTLFSAKDLNWSLGTVASIGAGAVAGYTAMNIFAGPSRNPYFNDTITGFGTMAGGSGLATIGLWKWTTTHRWKP